MENQPLRINLVGTDGSGKSTVLGLLRDRFEEETGQAVVCHNPSGITYPEPRPFEPRTNPDDEPWCVYGGKRMIRSSGVEDEAITTARRIGAIVVLGDRDFETCHPVYYPILMRGGPLEGITRQQWQESFRAARYHDSADAIFWLDVDPEIAMNRINGSDRDRVQNHEKKDTIAELRAGYAEVAAESEGRITRIDTNKQSPQEVAEEIWRQISQRFDLV